ncbi:hypothetical protein E2K73_03325 [Acinetobacter sp. RF15A]|uniref:hypothetical protein n=1 Tax=unclassified Acinetobacter TaxID=196816 RepID=UPI001196FADE|nr:MULTISPECIES: hypothetical protein [unclassified Acinetobacter]TSH77796.1 hypothetical protein E2K73_03325 [Acinetobacter sp. RF15A]TSI21232.1 hypothetical protein E2K74_01405 [Acinetobacter sp. RF15B]
MNKMKILILLLSLTSLTACQIISPLFVDYNGVRRDVAQWINHHQLLSMQQKRALVQLSKAQQKINRFAEYDQSQQWTITQENQIALYCAGRSVSEHKIQQLQEKIHGDETAMILQRYEQLAPKIKLDLNAVQCE